MRLLNDQITDQIVAAFKSGKLSMEKKDATLTLLSELSSFPKKAIPEIDFEKVKNQVLDRIAIVPEAVESSYGFWQMLPRFLKIGGTILASLLIVASLTLATAAAALDSVPGSPLYPLKKVAENVRLKLAHNENEKTNLQIKFAENRLTELEKILEQGKEGKISEEEVQKTVNNTVEELQKTSRAVAHVTSTNSNQKENVSVLTKLVDLNNKTAYLKAASIDSAEPIKIELEKAIAVSKISQEEAIKNIENAGLKVETRPISIEETDASDAKINKVNIKGKITAFTKTSVSIGTAKFLLTKDTKYINTDADKMALDQIVEIDAEVKDNKTYALEITAEVEVKTNTETAPQTAPAETQQAQ